ncbi:hypothetical protein CERSUDRAFT_83236 [Gelatoporia subvermispora B]|uniref:DUF6534 domain-containing protein n=1 Tax=Ceriporiopsis subvermispora (strain B) TaxID=914234 RepID=M2QKG2_CERS8|nr:hypothetical protein CERSUDRAFT_83236 [Gelatoporia subvermispora B]
MSVPNATSLLNGTLGALEISLMVELVLYGVTTIQTYIYFSRGDRDPLFFRCLVGLLWLMDTLHQIFFCHAIYTYTVLEFGNVLGPNTETWSIIANIPLNPSMEAIARGMFCYRIWKFSGRNWLVVGLIMLCSLTELAGAVVFTVRNVLNPQWSSEHAFSDEFYCMVAGSVVADALVALSQVTLLRKHHSEFPKTNSVLHSLMLYSINTGLLTSLCALIMCILWVTMPTNLVYVGFFAALPTLLINALLATLNARRDLRDMITGNPDSLSFPLSDTAQSSHLVSQSMGNDPVQESAGAADDSAEFKLDRSDQVV